MTIVRAIEPFEHNGSVQPGQRITVSSKHAQQLIDKGLAVSTGETDPVNETSDPFVVAGVVTPSSALPAAPASPQTMSSKSESGKKRGRKPKNALSS